MTHDELLAKINEEIRAAEFEEICGDGGWSAGAKALRAVVELHSQDFGTPSEDVVCDYCKVIYPCPTIQAIEKELL